MNKVVTVAPEGGKGIAGNFRLWGAVVRGAKVQCDE